jgi:chitinase
MTSYGFDGVDIALEFSDEDVPEDKLALTTLFEVCRNLKKKNRIIFIGNCKTKTINVTFDYYINSSTIC